MEVRELLGAVLLLTAVPFFLAGTLGLLRFPDVFCRLHALTKADNLGLGLIVLGLMVQARSWQAAASLFLTWLLVLLAGATVAHLIARKALADGQRPWSRS
ncbi:multisubunit sodium/proton antiporter, MrpG subunit (TC 2.A.63.1) [Geoalkalibacter ferrihydriticus]|uniref:Cation:proton antiporter n=2 Tax=Geoalkalibacter ferrihydriticus TaxID=392333 RepID=A0A0C2EAV3_9BACT|nr:monovalent cation/H(+) antiporter subunit G [Geoalkalibacter ferrihydriticus]KIH75698.1 cation:proton antiporter [Geoalkalibacter ferrihydriticus DSM 17813]SDM74265.1 multisubunit sodium/proton antiporter, MrpG subunit (TC 2.A.63.1) [Geoalkalibacter ferrihydriticus]